MGSRARRVVILGLGPIGRAVAREVVRAPDLELVGAVDPAPTIAGRALEELIGARAGLRVVPDLDSLPRRRTDVAVHLSASRFPEALSQVKPVLARGIPIVSTCEELIAARCRFPREAAALDRVCRKAGVALVATGVNPGFAMDLLPVVVANVSVAVRSIHVERVVDTSRRRIALQAKTGAGITRAEFRERLAANRIGHVGLRDSLIFLVNQVPLEAEATSESIRPILAPCEVAVGRRRIEKGRVLGVHHRVKAVRPDGKAVATFVLKMAYGIEDPHDSIRIDGDPPLRLRFEGGISGDRATVGAVLSAVRSIEDAPAGLGTRFGMGYSSRKR